MKIPAYIPVGVACACVGAVVTLYVCAIMGINDANRITSLSEENNQLRHELDSVKVDLQLSKAKIVISDQGLAETKRLIDQNVEILGKLAEQARRPLCPLRNN